MQRAVWLVALILTSVGAAPTLSPANVSLNSLPAAISGQAAGACLAAGPSGPQALFATLSGEVVVELRRGETVTLTADLGGLTAAASLRQTISAGAGRATLRSGGEVSAASAPLSQPLSVRGRGAVTVTLAAPEADAVLRLAPLEVDGQPLPWRVTPTRPTIAQPMPKPRPAIAQALVEIDWRLQDGVGTPLEPRSWADATRRTLDRGLQLAAEQRADAAVWRAMLDGCRDYANDDPRWQPLWQRAHGLKRELALRRIAGLGPLAFVKQAPGGMFSHQLTQYYGSSANPGGGVFALDSATGWAPRALADGLPMGSYQHLDVSYDGRSVLFAYCPVDTIPRDREERQDRHFSLYRVDADGHGLRRLTSGEYDDFAPRWLPNGQIVFVSTRRGGFHRCGRGPCQVYTLALLPAEGAEPRVISFHETHEWDPAVLNDGRLAYTRWDYVDRSAVQYQQLWTVRPDGSGVSILYGNHTLNPTGVWEARAVPGSGRLMATAAAHHAMTAGSIVLVDPNRGVDGFEPLTRLTPDVPFPESETRVLNGQGGAWGPNFPPAEPLAADARRWPGSSYRSAWPLSERVFLAAYGYEPLIGEPMANPPNQFGLYLVDAAGNRELLYRDLNLSSLWPMPLAPRAKPPTLPVQTDTKLAEAGEGAFLMQNVHQAWPMLPESGIRALRIVQVLPKTTPHANDPTVGLANASPGKQVLGTVPVEADGSAYFRAPARIPLLFQALDAEGRAVQTMRSLTYLQPGETATCIGCHERRTSAPGITTSLASRRAPSAIAPGPDGSRPLSFARLVQPVLDRQCVSCHTGAEPAGKVRLTAEPEGAYSVSYLALAPRVPFSAWGGPNGNFEPVSPPDSFGARGSAFLKALLTDHHGVKLTADDRERLITWADANALFYGTFNRADQERQRRGELIAGPDLE